MRQSNSPAATRYAELQNEADRLIGLLQAGLRQHAMDAATPNWNQVGDLQYVVEQLEDLVEFLRR